MTKKARVKRLPIPTKCLLPTIGTAWICMPKLISGFPGKTKMARKDTRLSNPLRDGLYSTESCPKKWDISTARSAKRSRSEERRVGKEGRERGAGDEAREKDENRC